MYRNKQYFRKILKSDKGRVLEDYMFQRSSHSIRTRLMRELELQFLPEALLTKVEFCCAGAQHIVNKWFLEDTGEMPNVIADRILDCFPEPVRSCCVAEGAPAGELF